MKLKLFLVAFLVLVLNAGSAFGQVFSATYDFASVTMTSGTTDPTPVPTATGVTFGSFTATGLSTNPIAAARFGFSGYDTGATNGSDTFSGAINTGKYIQVTITPAVGYNLDINSIIFTSQRSGTGPRQYAVRSSVDGYGANLPASISPANANLSVVATNIFQTLDSSSSAQNGSVITLGAAYDALSGAVTFRFYGWNAEAAGGTFGIDNVVIDGEAIPTGPCSDPLTQDATPVVTNRTVGGADITWTEAVGASGSIVVITPIGQTVVAPVDGTSYTPNANWASAGQINTNNRVVYRNSAGTVTGLSGLTAGTEYTVTVYAYNGTGTNICYNTASPATATFFTLATEPTAHSASLTCTPLDANSIRLNFSAASTIPNARGYFVLYSTGSAPTGVPTDGAFHNAGTVFGDATVHGSFLGTATTTYIAGGLTTGVTYYFSLVPFSMNVANDFATINYRTAGAPVTFCTPTAAEINVRGFTGGTNSITSGTLTTTSGLDNTAFGNINLGSNITKDYQIQNTGSAVLNLTGAPLVSIGGTNPGDFVVTTVPGTNTIAAGGSTTFIITFTPQAAGPRSAIVSIANNDSDENPYTYLINGTGVCLATANTITPTSGPVGTEVTITATTNNLTGATVVIGGANATPVTQVSSTQITVLVPTGAFNGSGALITTNAQGCQASNSFTVIGNATTTCQGGSTASDLFISEVTDATVGGLSYIEVYNGTGASVTLTNYALQFFANGSATSYTTVNFSGTLANGATYTVSTSTSGSECAIAGGNGSLANLITAISGVNFADGADITQGHDHIALYKSGVKIDSWGTYMNQSWAVPLNIGDRGADFRRKNTATVPTTAYSNADWDVTDWIGSGAGSCSTNDYSNIGVYNFLAGTPPTVTVQPSYTPTCSGTTLSIAGLEGYNGVGDTMELTYQWYAVAPSTATWTALTNAGLYSGVTTATLTISNVATLIGYQFYCQIRENADTCFTATNAVKIIAGSSTTWQASNSWSNGVPTLDTAVIIDHTYDTANAFSPSFNACSVTVNNARNVIVRGNNYILIKEAITVTGTGTATFENNSSLVQINNVTNSGSITYKRLAQQRRSDYVYWSSPVEGYSLSTLPSDGYKLTWNTTVNNTNGTQGNWQFYSSTMNLGKGYIVGGPSSFNNTSNQDFEVPFFGIPRNGDIPVTINRGAYEGPNYTLSTGALVTNLDDNWNLLGNPYPSAISCRDFLSNNSSVLTGALYIWTHGTLPSIYTGDPFYQDFISNYDPNADYLPFNLTGNLANPNPDYHIGAGQGFFVVMQDGAEGSATVNFTNTLRNITYGNVTGTNFYRNANNATNEVQAEQFNRIWLDIVKEGTPKPVRTMFGYVDGATMGRDHLYDALTKNDNTLKLYTVSGNDKFVIQGRSLPFNEFDLVPLGVDVIQSGSYKIAIGMVDGLFTETNQRIYLEDTYLNIIHDLRQAPYQFTSVSGIYNDRFIIRYTTNALGNPDFDTLNNSVVVAGNNGVMTIKSSLQTLEEVTVYDVLGRQLFNQKGIGANNLSASNISMSQQSLIVKIKLESGTIVTKKVLIN
ncbi:choice-of-anchor D domain-containing protein [Flavobacterium sp.]|uniref:choice-of-anchor D domain-containing protein n=1 Tax=Flavobacterium sp. TaxID=239 RepID=UPI00391C9348